MIRNFERCLLEAILGSDVSKLISSTERKGSPPLKLIQFSILAFLSMRDLVSKGTVLFYISGQLIQAKIDERLAVWLTTIDAPSHGFEIALFQGLKINCYSGSRSH